MSKRFLFFIFIFGIVFFSFADGKVEESSSKSSETVVESLDASLENKEVENVEKSKTEISFNLGNLQWFEYYRAKYFYRDYFGWYPQILMSLGAGLFLSGVKDMNLVFSGMTLGKEDDIDTSVKLRWGGGYEFFRYDLGPDGKHLNNHIGEDFWKKQAYYESIGQSFVNRGYERGYAQWGLDWLLDFGFKKSPYSNIDLKFSYDGKFVDNLEDNRPESEQWLFRTDYPDRDRYLLHTFSFDFDYHYRTEVDQRFKHELYNISGMKIGAKFAPGFMNVSITAEHKKDLTNQGQVKRDEFGNIIYTDKLRTTADFYTVKWEAYVRRKIFDVNPNRKSVLFAGFVKWGATVSYTDELGPDGYIPLDFRILNYDQDDFRHYQRNTSFLTHADLIFMLPEVRVEDFKGWSSPKINSDWAVFENAIGDFLTKFGITPNYKEWNDVRVIKPELRFNLMTRWEREFGNSNKRRIKELWFDDKDYIDIDFWIDFNMRLFDVLNLGLIFKFELDKWEFYELWIRFG